jgi:hypothetical protein
MNGQSFEKNRNAFIKKKKKKEIEMLFIIRICVELQ